MNVQQSGNRRSRRTRAVLQATLLDLVTECGLAQISVSDVTKRADVNRSTFYEHYTDVHDLARAACGEMFDGLPADVAAPGPEGVRPPRPGGEVVAGIFGRIAENAEVYRALLGPDGSARVIDDLRRRIAIALQDVLAGDVGGGRVQGPVGEAGHALQAAFGAGAVLGVAADWLRRGCPERPEELGAEVWSRLSGDAPLPGTGEGGEWAACDERHPAEPSDRSGLTDRTATLSGMGHPRSGLRGQLLEAALRLFAVHGFRGTSLQDIANAAGCSKGTVLYHFANKGAILAELLAPVLQAGQELRERMTEVPADRATEAAVEGFADVALRYRREIGLLLSDLPEATRSMGDLHDPGFLEVLLDTLAGRSTHPEPRLRAWMALGAIFLAATGGDSVDLPAEEQRTQIVRGAMATLHSAR